jgi:hypothetical protein
VNLYLATYTNDDGENMDQIIQETSPERAADTWRNFWISEEILDKTYFDGKFEAGVPTRIVDDVLRIFEINANPGIAGVLDWHCASTLQRAGGVTLHGYINP